MEKFKIENLHLAETGNFWDVSEVVLNKIEGKSYLDNKLKQLEYLKLNPGVAFRKGINMRGIYNLSLKPYNFVLKRLYKLQQSFSIRGNSHN